MPGPVGSGSGLRAVLAVAMTAGLATAQEPPTAPVNAVQPGSLGTPQLAPPSVPPGQPSGVPTQESRQLGAPVPAYPPPLVADPYLAPPAVAPTPVTPTVPLPGSLADQLAKEYEARQGFRVCTWSGTVVTALPGSLIWLPPIASPREPRFAVSYSTLDNYKGSWSLDTSIGNTIGLLRAEPAGADTAYQFDLFGVVHTRLTPEDVMLADYRFGTPLTGRWGDWHAKLAYEHTSAHVGDRLLRAIPSTPNVSWAKDEVVVGLGRWVGDYLRVYGQISYAFFQVLPDRDQNRKWRFDYGLEAYDRGSTGWSGTPYVAVNATNRGDLDYRTQVNAQAGWIWRNPYQRLGNFRLYAEYTTGPSKYGQFDLRTETYGSIGMACDY